MNKNASAYTYAAFVEETGVYVLTELSLLTCVQRSTCPGISVKQLAGSLFTNHLVQIKETGIFYVTFDNSQFCEKLLAFQKSFTRFPFLYKYSGACFLFHFKVLGQLASWSSWGRKL